MSRDPRREWHSTFGDDSVQRIEEARRWRETLSPNAYKVPRRRSTRWWVRALRRVVAWL